MLAKTRNRMATAITFSREKDAGTRLRTTQLVMGKSRSLSRRPCIKILRSLIEASIDDKYKYEKGVFKHELLDGRALSD